MGGSVSPRRRTPATLACAAALGLYAAALPLGCGGQDIDEPIGDLPGIALDITGDPPELLSATHIMKWTGNAPEYHSDIHAYELNTPLFSDYALKYRAIYVPHGEAATWEDFDVFDFPPGSALIKSFAFPEDFRSPTQNVRLIETRLLIRYEDGWRGYPYIWRADGSDADLSPAGEVRSIDFIDVAGSAQTAAYLVPQKNQCIGCHERKRPEDGARQTVPLGPKARNLQQGDQLLRLANSGIFYGAPVNINAIGGAVRFDAIDLSALDTMPFEQLDRAARDYLDVNCAHCHNPNGVQGISSQLFLNWDNTDDFHLGVCKRPGSAGAGGQVGEYDIVPGDPNTSILLFRLETEELGAMMPLLGRSLEHKEGSAVIRTWVERMPAAFCSP